MTGAFGWGVLTGTLFAVLSALGNSVAWTGFWAVQTALVTTYTTLTWRRTGLLWMTLGGAHATIVSAAMVLASLAGYSVETLPFVWKMTFLANAVLTAAFHFVARAVHRDEFELWRQHMESMSMWDMLRFKHIPYRPERRRSG